MTTPIFTTVHEGGTYLVEQNKQAVLAAIKAE